MQLTVTKQDGGYVIEIAGEVDRLIKTDNREEVEQLIQAYL